MFLELKPYNKSNYSKIVNNAAGTCRSNYYDGSLSNDFFSRLLEESDYHCYYCGQSLKTNNNEGIYFEKEHIINKKQKKIKNKALNKCKYNLIPICKTCNSKKLYIDVSHNFSLELKNLENNCLQNSICNIKQCKNLMEIENFDPFSENIKFDILHKYYYGDDRFISQFDLNKRSTTIFSSIFDVLYDISHSGFSGEFIVHLNKFSNNVLDKKFIGFLEDYNLINDNGTLKRSKINNLLTTITLLEEFE